MARRDFEAELRRHLAGERIDLRPVLRSLPETVDVEPVVAVVTELIDHGIFYFARNCQRLPAPVIREVITRELPGMIPMFLRLAVPADAKPAALVKAWQRALAALLDLQLTYAWGSKQRRTKLRALAKDRQMLAAIQGTAAHRDDVPLDMLAVLVADGSDASFDALVRHIAVPDRLDRLARLRTHAVHTPALDALFAEIDGALGARNAASGVLALGPLIGVGEVDTLWFQASISSREHTEHRIPRVQANVRVDSRHASPFRVYLTARGKTTQFTGTKLDDPLELGRCEPAELPGWLAQTAKRLRITWDVHYLRSGLRGGKRDRVASWLMSGA